MLSRQEAYYQHNDTREHYGQAISSEVPGIFTSIRQSTLDYLRKSGKDAGETRDIDYAEHSLPALLIGMVESEEGYKGKRKKHTKMHDLIRLQPPKYLRHMGEIIEMGKAEKGNSYHIDK